MAQQMRFSTGAPDGEVGVAAATASGPHLSAPEGPSRSQRLGTFGAVSVLSAMMLVAGDAFAFAFSGFALLPFGAADGATPQTLALIAAGTIWFLGVRGLYPGHGVFDHEALRRRVVTTATVAIPATAVLALVEGWRSAVLVAAFLAMALAAQPLVKAQVRAVLRRLNLWGQPVSILADAATEAAVQSYLAANWRLGLRPAPTNRGPRIAVVAAAFPSAGALERMRRDYDGLILLADLPGTVATGLRLADTKGEVGLRIATHRPHGWEDRVRRAFDILIASVALVVAGPIILLAGVLIRRADPGPVFYRQTREGFAGRPFRVLKLRTMYRDADQRLAALLKENAEARAEWSSHCKLRDDPRVLPGIGGLLRRTSIDELPQLWNVLAGDMRIVGPRPFPDYHLSKMRDGFRAKRASVRPGLTGLWQVSGRSDADVDRQEALDDFYIDNRSLWLDLDILTKTPRAVLSGTGAY